MVTDGLSYARLNGAYPDGGARELPDPGIAVLLLAVYGRDPLLFTAGIVLGIGHGNEIEKDKRAVD